jgi:protein-L-isoaspartate(D-aspartate) O-methyltransferase
MNPAWDEMLEEHLRKRGIVGRVLEAFRQVDRARFVPATQRESAYDDRALSITHGQTISQPYMVAMMLRALEFIGTEKVLEIGTGSGYQTALLSELAREVHTVERIEYLATTAEDLLRGLGYQNIHFRLGDGSLGWPEHGPYDRIVVSAACPALPPALVEQLGEGGLIAAPVGPPEGQELVIGRKEKGRLQVRNEGGCIFVRLVGAQGYPLWSGGEQ